MLKNTLFFLKISLLHQFSLESSGTSLLYFDLNKLANFASFAWKNDGFILACSAIHILLASLGVALYEHLYHLADLALVALE